MIARSLLSAALALFFGAAANADEIKGSVIAVKDGDTIQVRAIDGSVFPIRLAEIDAPEKLQAYGDQSAKALKDLIGSKAVRAEITGVDRYGRTLAHVFVGKKDLGKAMVKSGHAWAYTGYVQDCEYFRLQADAFVSRLGLWALPTEDRTPPWVWRRQN